MNQENEESMQTNAILKRTHKDNCDVEKKLTW